MAAEGGHLDLVTYFLEKGVDVDIKESFGVSAEDFTTESQGCINCKGKGQAPLQTTIILFIETLSLVLRHLAEK